MIHIQRFINELMNSNCYILYDDVALKCIVIDPASEKCINEIHFVTSNKLSVDYIILTHEHTDHTWGVNELIDLYNPCVICSESCQIALPNADQAYFRFYYNNSTYKYVVCKIDHTIESLNYGLHWLNRKIIFINTPGHSKGSMCFSIDNMLFSGDTIMQYKPFFDKKSGSKNEYKKSISTILTSYDENTIVYPGHGEAFALKQFNIKNHD